MVMEGPRSPIAYDTRPEAMLGAVPVNPYAPSSAPASLVTNA